MSVKSFCIVIITLAVSLKSANAYFDIQDVGMTIGPARIHFALIESDNAADALRITANESRFMQQIQPLLDAQRYAEVEKAFLERPLKGDSPALLHLRAQVLLNLGQTQEAILSLEKAKTLVPNSSALLRTLGLAYLLVEQHENAQQILQKAVSLGVNDATVYGQLAYLNLKSNGPWSAVAGFRNALFLEPDNKQWQQGLAYALIQAGANGEAEGLLAQLTHDSPKEVDWWLLRANLAVEQRAPNRALSYFEIAMRLAQEDKSAQYHTRNLLELGKMHAKYGEEHAALRYVDLALAISTSLDLPQVESTMVTLGEWFASQQKWSQLEMLLGVAQRYQLSTVPKQLWLASAQSAIGNKQFSHAEALLRSGLKSAPQNGPALLLLAGLLKQQGKVSESTIYFQRAATNMDVKESAMLSLSQLYIDSKQYQLAFETLTDLLRVNPERRELKPTIAQLERLLSNLG
ncbi:hypothetical protein PALB_24910 [Pseudoalteromonas luteoviolacea B = ATCC 29581]|nr:hypothetical protein PALB_24910 [Pseudoalteromonas luteoviolacea B = ATCC 29581]